MEKCTYQILVSENGRYIIVEIVGKITTECAASFSKDADQLGREKGLSCFLFDATKAVNISNSFENYDYANRQMRELGLNPDVKSAVLVHPEDNSHEYVRVVVNNAGYKIRIFTDKQDAINWLQESLHCQFK